MKIVDTYFEFTVLLFISTRRQMRKKEDQQTTLRFRSRWCYDSTLLSVICLCVFAFACFFLYLSHVHSYIRTYAYTMKSNGHKGHIIWKNFGQQACTPSVKQLDWERCEENATLEFVEGKSCNLGLWRATIAIYFYICSVWEREQDGQTGKSRFTTHRRTRTHARTSFEFMHRK